jgi:hypothetical protein
MIPSDRLDGAEQIVLAARSGIEKAARWNLSKRKRHQIQQRLRMAVRAVELCGLNDVTQRLGPFSEPHGR